MEGNHVVISLEEYNRLYDNTKELERLKMGLVTVDTGYNSDEPKVHIHIPDSIISLVDAQIKEINPDYEVSRYELADTTIWSGAKKIAKIENLEGEIL